MGINIVMVGSGGVGKSALTLRFVKSEFSTNYNPTIDSSFTKLVQVSPGETVQVDIHDTAGQEAFSSIREKYYPDADGFILCYSITDDETLSALKDLHEQILDLHSNPHVPLCLVGTKADLADTDRVVSVEEGKSFAESINAADFYETSAKTNNNVTEIFISLARSIARGKGSSESYRGGSVFGSDVLQRKPHPEKGALDAFDPKPASCCVLS